MTSLFRRMDSKTRKCRIDFFAIGARLRHDRASAKFGFLKASIFQRLDSLCMPSRCTSPSRTQVPGLSTRINLMLLRPGFGGVLCPQVAITQKGVREDCLTFKHEFRDYHISKAPAPPSFGLRWHRGRESHPRGPLLLPVSRKAQTNVYKTLVVLRFVEGLHMML